MSRTSLSLSSSNLAQFPKQPSPPLAIDGQVKSSLAQHDVFQGVASQILDTIVDRMQIHLFKAGDQIISEGEESRALFFIIKGVVTIGSEASESTIAELGPGLFFGETGVLFGGKRTMTARAKTKALLVSINKELLYDALQLDPVGLKNVKMKAEQRIQSIEEQLKQLSSGASPLNSNPSLSQLKITKGQTVEKNREGQSYPILQTNQRNSGQRQQLGTSASRSKESMKNRRTTLFMSSDPSSFDYQDAAKFGKKSSCSSNDSGGVSDREYDSTESAKSPFSSFSPDDDFEKVFRFSQPSCLEQMKSMDDSPRASVAVWNDPALSRLVGGLQEAGTENMEQGQTILSSQNNRHRRSSLSFTEFNSHGLGNADKKAPKMITVQEEQSQLSPPSPLGKTAVTAGLKSNLPSVTQAESMSTKGSSSTSMSGNKETQETVYKLVDISDLMQFISLQSSSHHRFVTADPRSFERVDLEPFHNELTDDKLLAILKFTGQRIKHLSLQDCWGLSNQSMKYISDHCDQLVSLNLQSCWNITTEGIAQLCNPEPILDSDRTRMSTSLKVLNLSNCTKLDDESIHQLAACFRDLSQLNIAYCKCLTNESLLTIATRWSSLKKLSLQRCTGLNDDGWAPLLKLFTENKKALFEDLEDLDLSDGSFITNLTLQIISQLCPNLKRLNLSFCCSLTSQAIGFLVDGCRYIEDLDFSFCNQLVTDDSLIELLQHAHHLSSLKIRSTLEVTDRFVAFLLETTAADDSGASTGKLRVLNISNCYNISESAIEQLSKKWNVIRNEGSSQQRQQQQQPSQSLVEPRRNSCYV